MFIYLNSFRNFVCLCPMKIIARKRYIQVSQTVQNAMTLERELAPFNSIADHHEKLLITMDFDTGTYNGIKKINAIDWLTKTEK